MNGTRSTAAHASVAFLHLPGFDQQPVAEQARLKARLEAVLNGALDALGAHERIVLDAEEGFAVVVLADPRGALRFAWCAARAPDLSMAIGLAHGPVRVTQGPPAVIFGDALTSAEAVARATAVGGTSASGDFRDALARSAPGTARLLARSGAAVDTHDRAHVIFDADRAACARLQKRLWAVVGGIAVAILVSGAVLRVTGSSPASSPGIAGIPSVPSTPVIVQQRPGTVTFDIRPAGEIWVNGALKGKTPPLKSIQLLPGRHTIEIRSGTFKPLVTELTIEEGEQLAVQHAFSAPAKQQPAKGFWRKNTDKVKEIFR